MNIRIIGHHLRATALATVAIAGVAAFASASASATDFCTDIADPACPVGASFAANIETAMVTNGKDGVKDRIFINAGTHNDPNGFFPNDPTLSDDLEVIGAGRENTIITTTSSSNIYLVNLAGIFLRDVTMRDLTLRVPASFPDAGGFGSALQSYGDTFERVNFESRNPVTPTHNGTGAVTSIIRGGTFKDVRMFGSEGGGFDQAFGTSQWSGDDSLLIEDSDIQGFQGGVTYNAGYEGIPVHIRRSRFKSDYGTVLGVYNANSSVENSVIEAGEFPPFQIGTLSATSTPASLVARNNTILNQGGAETAFNIAPSNTSSGNASAVISDSIIFGFAKSWTASALADAPGSGDANIAVTYSNFENPGTHTGDGTAEATVGNISQTPLFTDFTDYRLSPESPSIDAGNPAPGGIIDDIEGTVRPLDGNGDGTAVRDQGAYEAPAKAIPPTCETDLTLCPQPPPTGDTVAPKLSRIKFKAPAKKKAGFLRLTLSETATVNATFKPTPKGKGGKKRRTVKLSKRGKAGANKFAIKKRKLKPGRYRLTISAVDAAGNKSKNVVRKVRVKPARR